MRIKHVFSLSVLCSLLMLFAGQATAQIIEDFEGQTIGSSTPPTGWSLITVAGAPTFVTEVGSDGAGGDAGLAGQITSNDFLEGRPDLPGAYLVNDSVFDLTQPITGSFDAQIPADETFDDFVFVLGNVGTTVTGEAAGDLLSTKFVEGGGGSRADVISNGIGTGTGGDEVTRLDSNTAENGFVNDTWYRISFTWTPTSGTTGDFAITLNDFTTDLITLTATEFTFDSADAQFGFGSVNDIMKFDNVNIEVGAIAPPVLGDVNLDGVADFLDITPFISVLSNTEFQAEADIDQNGSVDFLDITPFIAILSGS